MGGPLGLTPQLSGKVAHWFISSARPASLDWPQKIVVGTVDGGGSYNVTLPAQPPAARQMTLKRLIRQFHSVEDANSICAVDTLVISAPDAVAGKVDLFYVARNAADTGAAFRPQFSPTPPYNVFKPFTQYFNASEMLLYSSVAATARGELSCTSPYSSGGRYHLLVNIALAQGWNSATLLYGEERMVGGERLQKMLLKGGLGRSGLNP